MPRVLTNLLGLRPSRSLGEFYQFLGVDPGLSGGLSLISDAGRVIEATPMPSGERDLWEWLKKNSPILKYAVIERIDPHFPGIGKSSACKLYGNFQQIKMALTALEIPFEVIRAGEWQKFWGIPPRKKTENTRQWKDRIRIKAQEVFPSVSAWSSTKKEQLAICDAVLVSGMCWKRQTLGE